MLLYILWNVPSELFSIGRFTLRWNALLLIVAYILCRQLLMYIYRKEGKSLKIDSLTGFLVLGTLIGSRLVYVLFYQPRLLRTSPLQLFLPFEFKPAFHFTGMQGFSAYGAAFGIVIALWIFCRLNKISKGYKILLDRITIVIPVAAMLLLTGSFFNSDLTGLPTNSSAGTVFIRPVTKGIQKLPCCIMRNPNGSNPLDQVVVKKDNQTPTPEVGHEPIILYLFFKPGSTEQLVNEFLIGDVKTFLYDMADVVHEPGTEPLHFLISAGDDGNYVARVKTIGIARHPVQLYEALAYCFLFVFFFWYWNKYKTDLPAGRLSGCFIILFSLLTIASGYLKEKAPYFAKGIALPTEQLLSIPFIIFGIVLIVISYKKPSKT